MMRLFTLIFPAKLILALIMLAFAISSQGAPLLPKHTKMPGSTEAFMRAAYDGNLHKMQALLSKGFNAATTDEDGENALVWAANGGQPRIVEFLLNHGVSVKDKNGDEALSTAVDEGQTGIVKSLLTHGANVNARDKVRENATPLMIACFYDTGGEGTAQYPDIVKLLLMHQADVRARDNHGKTALMYLKNMPNARIHKMLLKAGAIE